MIPQKGIQFIPYLKIILQNLDVKFQKEWLPEHEGPLSTVI